MIIFVITDISGINNIKVNTLKKLNQRHNVLVININDNLMAGKDVYDIIEKEYIPDFLLNDNRLQELEIHVKKQILDENKRKLKRNRVSSISISSTKEINHKIIKLLEEHKYASTN